MPEMRRGISGSEKQTLYNLPLFPSPLLFRNASSFLLTRPSDPCTSSPFTNPLASTHPGSLIPLRCALEPLSVCGLGHSGSRAESYSVVGPELGSVPRSDELSIRRTLVRVVVSFSQLDGNSKGKREIARQAHRRIRPGLLSAVTHSGLLIRLRLIASGLVTRPVAFARFSARWSITSSGADCGREQHLRIPSAFREEAEGKADEGGRTDDEENLAVVACLVISSAHAKGVAAQSQRTVLLVKQYAG